LRFYALCSFSAYRRDLPCNSPANIQRNIQDKGNKATPWKQEQ
jgi:hypothetical protein